MHETEVNDNTKAVIDPTDQLWERLSQPAIANKQLISANKNAAKNVIVNINNKSEKDTNNINADNNTNSNDPNKSATNINKRSAVPEDIQEYIKTGHTTKRFKRRFLPFPQTPTVVQNKYSALADLDEDTVIDLEEENIMETEEEEHNKNNTSAREQTQTTKKPVRPPPIIIETQVEGAQKEFRRLIGVYASKGFQLSYRTDTVSVQLNDKDEYCMLLAQLQNRNFLHHTYTPKDERTHAFVLKGLTSDAGIDEIEEELKTKEITTKKVYRMNGTQTAAFLVVTTSDTTLREISTKVKTLLDARVRWERHFNNKVIIQCHRCQTWGHATANCGRAVKCLKCANNHATKECKLTAEQKPKCVNCDGEHPANAIVCPVYIAKLKIYNEKKESRAPPQRPPAQRYVPAPMPKTSPWQRTGTAPAQTQPSRTPPPPPTSRSAFPPLRTPRQPQTPPPTQTPRQQQPPAASNVGDAFAGLAQVCEEINQQTDMSEMLRALTDYNNVLKGCNTKMERFTASLKFFSTLESYGC